MQRTMQYMLKPPSTTQRSTHDARIEPDETTQFSTPLIYMNDVVGYSSCTDKLLMYGCTADVPAEAACAPGQGSEIEAHTQSKRHVERGPAPTGIS